MSLTTEDLKTLAKPFDANTIGVKVQAYSKQKDKAMLVLYAQHTDVAARLEEVDPSWSSEITHEQRVERYFVVRMRLTIKGVSRENIGEGEDPKSAASDALKRAASLFGVGRYLYDSPRVWVPYNEQQDYYREFTYTEYQANSRGAPPQAPPPAAPPGPAPGPAAGPRPITPPRGNAPAPTGPLSRAEIGKKIVLAAKALKLSDQDRDDWVRDLYKVPMIRMSEAQMTAFLGVLEGELGRIGITNYG